MFTTGNMSIDALVIESVDHFMRNNRSNATKIHRPETQSCGAETNELTIHLNKSKMK